MSVREIHLCIVWDRARHIQDAFIEQLRARFKLLAAYELTWSEERFATNLSRFYGKKLTADSDKQRHCGTGSFLVLLFEDESPVYAHRLTLGGRRRVNSAVFDLKDHFRSRAQGSLPIHATNDIDETRHDLFLLLGQRLEDFVASVADSEWQGQIKQLRQELVGDSGWASLPELFTALNETTPYVVLRNFDDLPGVYTSGEHGDIDLLVELQQPIAQPVMASARLEAKLMLALGLQKIDVIVSAPNVAKTPIHDIAAKGIRL